MAHDGVWFLIPIFVPLDRELVWDVLFETSVEMMAGQRNRRAFKGTTFEGVLSTDFKSVSLGSLSGTLFRAVVESGEGKSEGIFVLPDKSFESYLSKTSSQPMVYN